MAVFTQPLEYAEHRKCRAFLVNRSRVPMPGNTEFVPRDRLTKNGLD